MTEEVPDVFHLTDEQKKHLMEKKSTTKRDYVFLEEGTEDADPNYMEALEKEALELIIEHLKRLRYR
jgi:hypothetical protein